MKYNHYIKAIEESVFEGEGQRKKLDEIVKQISNDKDINDDEKLQLELIIRQILIDLSNKEKESDKGEEITEHKPIFPRYAFAEMDVEPLDCGVKEFGGFGVPYAIWLKDVYLPTFHPMPCPEIQYPIAVCLMLLNCNATIGAKMKLPIPYFLGRRGSGKTELAKATMNHYPKELRVEIRPNNTGAAIRDVLDSYFSSREPGIAVFDNFHPHRSLERLGTHYDLILANVKESSISRLSVVGNDSDRKSEYYTYCYKVFTSVFDLALETSEEAKEIERRTLTLCFKESEPSESRLSYSWNAMTDRFLDMWGDKALEAINSVYFSTLQKLIRKKPNSLPIKGSSWEICILPIAVGVYAGIFKDINAGIRHFADYFDWLPDGKGNHSKNPISIVVTEYINKELPILVQEDADNKFIHPDNRKRLDLIAQKDIQKHVESITSLSMGKKDLDEITFLMGEFGYAFVKRKDGMFYVKD